MNVVALDFECSWFRCFVPETVDGAVAFLIHHKVLESHDIRTYQTVKSSDSSIENLRVTLALKYDFIRRVEDLDDV